MSIEDKISQCMLSLSRFEFFLIRKNIDFAKRDPRDTKKVTGIAWKEVIKTIEDKNNFNNFDFKAHKIDFFKNSPPYYIIINPQGKIKWAENTKPKDWNDLIYKGFAQFRNNIAHGNKCLTPIEGREDYTSKFIEESKHLMHFISKELFGDENWEADLPYSRVK